MKVYELVAVLQAFPDDGAEVVVVVDGTVCGIGYVVRTLEDKILLGISSLAGDAPRVLES